MPEHLPQIQHDHPDVDIPQWSVQVDHIHVVLVISPKYAVLSLVGKMKANVSRQLRSQYPELKQPYWGAVLWSPGFFSSTVGLNEAVIRRYVAHQERVDKGRIQLELEFLVPRGVSPWVSTQLYEDHEMEKLKCYCASRVSQVFILMDDKYGRQRNWFIHQFLRRPVGLSHLLSLKGRNL